jgi:hypothetical protein
VAVKSSLNNVHPAMVVLGVVLFLVSILGELPVTSLYASLVMWVGLWLLWRPGESPILLFVFGYQWLQASITLFRANIGGYDWGELSAFRGDIEAATYLSLTGLLALAVGMRWGVGRWRAGPAQAAREAALRYDMVRWFQLYLLAFVVSMVAAAAARFVPALAQPLLALGALKWAFFFVLTYAAFLRPIGHQKLWSIAFGLELLLGFGGYFSSFKVVLIFTLLGIVAVSIRWTPRKVFVLTMLGAVSLSFGIMWTAAKTDYREFVSGGQSAQVVTVDYATSVSKLGELVLDLDAERLADATEDFANRLSYVDFFGATLRHVPAVISHTHGELWLDAIIRPFTPRALFPEKTAIHDSARTRKYTGVMVAGVSQGTSISIGYMGESYIDFGVPGMFFPVFAFGWLLGRSYRWLVVNAASRGLLGMGLASAALFGATYLESSITKVFGGLIAALLVAWLLNLFVFPTHLKWMLTGKARSGSAVAHGRTRGR